MRSEALKRAQERRRKKLVRFYVEVRADKDPEVVEFLRDKGNVQGFLRELVLRRMEEEAGE